MLFQEVHVIPRGWVKSWGGYSLFNHIPLKWTSLLCQVQLTFQRPLQQTVHHLTHAVPRVRRKMFELFNEGGVQINRRPWHYIMMI